MKPEQDLAPVLKARIDAIAKRAGSTPAAVIADALENGHSLAWQEHFLDKVSKGIAAADRGEFASAGDLDRVRNKYRSS